MEKKGGAVHFETVLRQVRTEAAAHHHQRRALPRVGERGRGYTATGERRGADTLVALLQTLVDRRGRDIRSILGEKRG